MAGAPIVQAKYDRLEEIAGRFGHLADEVTADRVRMRRASERLIHGGWEGKGVHSFSNEMNGDLFPGMQRLSRALREAQSVTLQLSAMLRQAEEEAAAVYNDNLGAVALGGGAAGARAGGGGKSKKRQGRKTKGAGAGARALRAAAAARRSEGGGLRSKRLASGGIVRFAAASKRKRSVKKIAGIPVGESRTHTLINRQVKIRIPKLNKSIKAGVKVSVVSRVSEKGGEFKISHRLKVKFTIPFFPDVEFNGPGITIAAGKSGARAELDLISKTWAKTINLPGPANLHVSLSAGATLGFGAELSKGGKRGRIKLPGVGVEWSISKKPPEKPIAPKRISPNYALR